MKTFKMQYIKNGMDGVMLVEAKDRWDAIRIFLKRVGMQRIRDLDYFHDEEVAARGITCFECTEYVDIDAAYVDIDGDQPRCGLGRDPLKCSHKLSITDNYDEEVTV